MGNDMPENKIDGNKEIDVMIPKKPEYIDSFGNKHELKILMYGDVLVLNRILNQLTDNRKNFEKIFEALFFEQEDDPNFKLILDAAEILSGKDNLIEIMPPDDIINMVLLFFGNRALNCMRNISGNIPMAGMMAISPK